MRMKTLWVLDSFIIDSPAGWQQQQTKTIKMSLTHWCSS